MNDDVKVVQDGDAITVTFGVDGMSLAQIAKWAGFDDGGPGFIFDMAMRMLPDVGVDNLREEMAILANISGSKEMATGTRKRAFERLCMLFERIEHGSTSLNVDKNGAPKP